MEIELKLALPKQQAARIRRHALLHAIKPNKNTLHSIYFDTPDFELMRRGIALRVRRIGYHWVQTLKADARAVGAMSSRPEWEMAVAGGASPDFSVLPPAALALLHGIDRARIAPTFATRFQRTTWQITRGGDQAELALDIGEIQAGEATQAISEIEIELKAGATDFLFDLALQLLPDADLTIEPRSKAERGYTLCGASQPAPVKAVRPDIHPRQNSSVVWQAVMQAALAQLVANVPGFLERAQEIEYLHQLRIALRRLRTGLALNGGPTTGSTRIAPDTVQRLRHVMRSLNSARDWDVFLHETLPKTQAALGAPAAPALGEEAMLALLREAAANSRQQAQALLRSAEFTGLVLELGRGLLPAAAAPAASGPAPAPASAQDWAASILEKRWRALRKRCRRFVRLGPAERHMARIAAKKLRYAAEAFAPLYPQGARRRAESLAALPPYESGLLLAGTRNAAEAATTPLYGKRGARFIAALGELQTALGSANDARVGAELLHTLPKKNLSISFELGRLEGAMQVEAAHHVGLSAVVWRRLVQSRLFWRG